MAKKKKTTRMSRVRIPLMKFYEVTVDHANISEGGDAGSEAMEIMRDRIGKEWETVLSSYEVDVVFTSKTDMDGRRLCDCEGCDEEASHKITHAMNGNTAEILACTNHKNEHQANTPRDGRLHGFNITKLEEGELWA